MCHLCHEPTVWREKGKKRKRHRDRALLSWGRIPKGERSEDGKGGRLQWRVIHQSPTSYGMKEKKKRKKKRKGGGAGEPPWIVLVYSTSEEGGSKALLGWTWESGPGLVSGGSPSPNYSKVQKKKKRGGGREKRKHCSIHLVRKLAKWGRNKRTFPASKTFVILHPPSRASIGEKKKKGLVHLHPLCRGNEKKKRLLHTTVFRKGGSRSQGHRGGEKERKKGGCLTRLTGTWAQRKFS